MTCSQTVQFGSNVPVLNNIQALRDFNQYTDYNTVIVLGNISFTDGDGGIYTFDSTNTFNDNGSSVVKPTLIPSSGAGRYVITNINSNIQTFIASLASEQGAGLVGTVAGETVQALLTTLSDGQEAANTNITNIQTAVEKLEKIPVIKSFGAIGDGLTNDTAAVQAAIASGESVLVTNGTYYVDSYSDAFSNPQAWNPASTGFAKINGYLIPFGDIHETLTLNVGPTRLFANLVDALTYLLQRKIYQPVTVQIDDGTYSVGFISFSHPDGNQVNIIGNQSTPGNVIMNVATTSTGQGFIEVNQGCDIALISGMTVNGDGWVSHGVWTPGHVGAAFLANGSSSMFISDIVINKMYYGVRSNEGSYIGATNLIVTEAGDVGVHAVWSGTIECPGAQVSLTADTGNNLGNGIMAECGGTITCEGATCSHNDNCGMEASSGGDIWGLNSNCFGNKVYNVLARANGVVLFSSGSGGKSYSTTAGSHGIRAETGGFVEANGDVYIYSNTGDGISSNGGKIECNQASVTNNTGFGIACRNNGTIWAVGTTNTGNTGGTQYADSQSVITTSYA